MITIDRGFTRGEGMRKFHQTSLFMSIMVAPLAQQRMCVGKNLLDGDQHVIYSYSLQVFQTNEDRVVLGNSIKDSQHEIPLRESRTRPPF